MLLQVVLAPAHCLAMATVPAALETVLCSPDGMRTIHLGPDGQEMSGHAPDEGFCPGCHGLPQVVLPEPLAVALPVMTVATGPAWHPAAPEALPPPARGPPSGPRAPPAFG
nr:DUF2946 family protein [Neoroseomonas soli]